MGKTHTISVIEEPTETVDDSAPLVLAPRFTYKVVNAIDKHGKTYRVGSNIELDEATAANFLAAGDIKEKS